MGESIVQTDPLAAQYAQGVQMQQPQQPAVTAGQPTQQVIVPENEWEQYVDFLRKQFPEKAISANKVSDEQASEAVANGQAIQVVKKENLISDQAVAFDASNMLGRAINVKDTAMPQFIEGLAKQLAEFAAKNNSSINMKGENTMENNNNQNQGQIQMGMLDQLKAQADNVSWGRIAKGAGLVGGGVVIGKFVFGKKADPEAAAALMNAAETMSKADPKAIVNAFGTVAKAGLSRIFGM